MPKRSLKITVESDGESKEFQKEFSGYDDGFEAGQLVEKVVVYLQGKYPIVWPPTEDQKP